MSSEMLEDILSRLDEHRDLLEKILSEIEELKERIGEVEEEVKAINIRLLSSTNSSYSFLVFRDRLPNYGF